MYEQSQTKMLTFETLTYLRISTVEVANFYCHTFHQQLAVL